VSTAMPDVDLVSLAGGLRSPLTDPVVLRAYERLAVDLITSSLEHRSYAEWDPGYLQMTDDEREAWINDMALELGPVLLRAALTWGYLNCELPSHWLARRRDGAPSRSQP
jgi:hypothetical protein